MYQTHHLNGCFFNVGTYWIESKFIFVVYFNSANVCVADACACWMSECVRAYVSLRFIGK